MRRLTLILVFAVTIAAADHAPGQAPTAQPPAAATTVPAPRVAAVPAAPATPAPLSPQEQAALDQLLAAWEARSAAVRTWSCTFRKWEYNAWSPIDVNGDQLPFSESTGELKYAAPDKGLFRVKELKQWIPEPGTTPVPGLPPRGRMEVQSAEAGEHWVCNGESIYQFLHKERQLRETRLPPEMRGKAISDGPLPFVFGAKAETLKKRYWMRIITPPDIRDQIWLEALPRFQVDAANFSKVELILQARDLMPFAIQMYKPVGQDRDVYQFDPRTNLIDKGLDMIRDFAKPMTPFGYKYVLDDPQAQTGPLPSVPGR